MNRFNKITTNHHLSLPIAKKYQILRDLFDVFIFDNLKRAYTVLPTSQLMCFFDCTFLMLIGTQSATIGGNCYLKTYTFCTLSYTNTKSILGLPL